MVELIRSNDLVLLSWMEARLAALGVEFRLFDAHTSVAEGTLAAIPRRLMVEEAYLPQARRVLAEAEAIARGERDPLD